MSKYVLVGGKSAYVIAQEIKHLMETQMLVDIDECAQGRPVILLADWLYHCDDVTAKNPLGSPCSGPECEIQSLPFTGEQLSEK